jgi:hypothetical protein
MGGDYRRARRLRKHRVSHALSIGVLPRPHQTNKADRSCGSAAGLLTLGIALPY